MNYLAYALALISSLGLAKNAVAAGGEVGNGGDSVLCVSSEANPFEGYYSLDYLMTYRHDNNNQDVVDVDSWESSKERLSRLLQAKYPDMARMFAQFVANLDNHSDYLRPYLWQEAAHGLLPIDDERIIRRLPANCLQQNGDQIDLIQTMIRIRRPEITIYQYDPTIYRELREQQPLQFSFLLVHEWLWDLTGDVGIIRDANRFLHSSAAETLDPAQFEQTLRSIGIDLGRTGFVPVCERSPSVRLGLETWARASCESIQDFASVPLNRGPLDLSSQEISELRLGDFSGLSSKLIALNLSHNHLDFLYRDIFSDLYTLLYLHLSDNAISALPVGLFDDLRLIDLHLDHNQLSDLPPNLLSRCGSLVFLDLSFNRFTEIRAGMFAGTFGRAISDNSDGTFGLDMSHNLLSSLDIGDFDDLTNLPKLFLSHNVISNVAPDVFAPLQYVRIIDLSNNQLSTLPDGIFSGLPKLKTVDLRGNQFSPAEIERIRNTLPAGVTLSI